MEGTRRHGVIAEILLLVALGFLWVGGCSTDVNTPSNPAAPIIRVQILSDCRQVDIAASRPVTAFSTGEVGAKRLELASGQVVPITLTAAGWQVGNVGFAPGELRFVPSAIGSVSIGKPDPGGPELQAYRGGYRLVPSGAGQFDVVNDVDVDSYLKGVVASEMPRTFLIEAYKAQAIAARTFALYESRTSGKGRSFDVYGDVRSQAYGGIAAESDKSRQAVDETSGVVLTIATPTGQQLFKTYFSACCGGIGQSSADAFGDPPQAPLMEQNVGTLCRESPRFSWPELVVRKDELTRRFRAWGQRRGLPEKDMAMVSRIDIESVNRFGRPARFIVADVRGYRYTLRSEELRNACNADMPAGGAILFSSFFKPVNEQDVVRFTDGHGWGHGVGMCQWCAQARAEQGMRHEQILMLSYPQSQRVRAY